MSAKIQIFNRDLSWIEFNRRVLHEAIDVRTPLLERLRFLSIFTSNLDEFFMKRVGGLKMQDDPSAEQKIDRIRSRIGPLLSLRKSALNQKILPAMKRQGMEIVSYAKLTPREKEEAAEYFQSAVFPVLTPLSVDPGHPFPFLSNLSVSIGVMLSDPDREDEVFARVKVPTSLPPFFELSTGRNRRVRRFVPMVELILEYVDSLFPGLTMKEAVVFRVTRSAEIERDEEDAEDLLAMMREEIRERRFAPVVRLEVFPDSEASDGGVLVETLKNELEIYDTDVYPMGGIADYTSLKYFSDLHVPDLKYPRWDPRIPPEFLLNPGESLFDRIQKHDLLVHHPFDSFKDTVVRFVEEAVYDPHVLAIKMTLYRTGSNSPFVPLLIKAAELGKQVVCLIELKARFDEDKNIQVAERLERAGIHVVYGIVGLKTHCKATLIVRQEKTRVRTYCHLSSGNYHAQTANLYTDLGIFTCNPKISSEVIQVFHTLTGISKKIDYENILVSPIHMKSELLRMIEQEALNAERGLPARIVAKMNALEDREIIEGLYRASSAGVRIQLIVRGFCCLIPGLKGLSENIEVYSVLGRFLEHSRIFFFQNGEDNPRDGRFYIASADWMHRNLETRVEIGVPLLDPSIREAVWKLLLKYLGDERQSWTLKKTGVYVQSKPSRKSKERGVHEVLMDLTAERDELLEEDDDEN
jgi:polyphosphate kinase